MALDAQQLAVFLALMEHRSIGRAAIAVGLTQPAVSRGLKRLEARLGAVLFERLPSGVVPTLAGETLLPYAQDVVSNMQTALEEIASLQGQSRSVVRVGAVASISNSLMPSAIERLLRKWPMLRVHLLEAVEDQLSDALARREIDIAIAGRMPHNEVPFSLPDRMTDSLVAIAHRDHPCATAGRLPLAELRSARWVLPPRTITPMREFVERFRAAGLEPPVATVETRSVSAIRALVASGQFISWQPRAILGLEGAGSNIVELDVPALLWHRQFYVFRRERGLLAPAATKLIEELRALCREATPTAALPRRPADRSSNSAV